ncbi:uncharacterized protein AMSG_11927 [Thecamonas trahens ATCC 50062]|uniref:Amidohydrolase 3 domain-containing protein n=1 Tax=Thecamonas trahens ATCC 50062 TaxID=461836 RepID=A0A0L0DBI3_THETB|nr:hypothetical protein AMSG_11927 [Thecamonas trahens ATCC 50062]KNC49709.1 hypothetical protein AMSG_11927 [Thecamonas trahens ATCC 50062]|eukprot:XP_013757607.1 hypothetical protein AMSG_11927 [Thecamonas trahens ATCC 50062]
MDLPTCSLLVLESKIWTGVAKAPWASALATAGDRIIAVGDDGDAVIAALALALGLDGADASEAAVVAAGARVLRHVPMVVPGFIDSHVHFLDGGFRLSSVQLRGVASKDAFVAAVAAFVARVPEGGWMTGGDWEYAALGALPNASWIDEVTGSTPVFLSQADGHMAVANSAAMALAGITAETADIDGGVIERETGSGVPTGLFRDNAMSLVQNAMSFPPAAATTAALEAAMAYVAEQGVTSVVDMGVDVGIPSQKLEGIDVMRAAHAEARLRTRVYAAIPLPKWEQLAPGTSLAVELAVETNDSPWLTFGSLKGFMDGSLGSHTALFREPFSDSDDGSRGLALFPREQMRDWIVAADAAGLHVMVHAIGDEAVSQLLDIFEEAVAVNGKRDRRFRIEHAQHFLSEDVARAAALGVIASMQPTHATDDGRWAEAVIGQERCKLAFPWNSLANAGIKLAFGSDWFVAPPLPLEGIYAAVARRVAGNDGIGKPSWIPEQCIDVETALRSYTVDAAYATFDEAHKGKLAAGMLADLAFLDTDLFAVDDAEAIRSARVDLTVVGGTIVFDRTVSHSSDFLEGHFPDEPIVPGVYLTEAAIQTGAAAAVAAAEAVGARIAALSVSRLASVRFRAPVLPGHVLETEVKLTAEESGGDVASAIHAALPDGRMAMTAVATMAVESAVAAEAVVVFKAAVARQAVEHPELGDLTQFAAPDSPELQQWMEDFLPNWSPDTIPARSSDGDGKG